ncbi:hypothetical protein YA0788_23570 [Pseudomonas corrugata]|uniref:hypothetical protein n=1 Tax=Pseudomonas corrugata TaxID=47879 RepID=UPI0018E5DB7D|nr:hypothetical protein [Pseudomonas corrugata]MBI6695107.1 hypothetical protein [Pseudomonas corrugata]
MEAENKPDKKRIVITTITSSCLFILPFTSAPEQIYFTIPLAAEFLAFCLILCWIEYKGKTVSKKKSVVKTALILSIDSSIEKLRAELDETTNPAIAKILNKQLVELYKEKSEMRNMHHQKLRDEIQKLEDDDNRFKLESKSIKEQLLHKASEEVEKITTERDPI